MDYEVERTGEKKTEYVRELLDKAKRKGTITFQEITREGIQNVGPAIEVMAANEQLDAHKNAVTVRLKSIKNL